MTSNSLGDQREVPLTQIQGFDARSQPVIGVDSHLPRVDKERLHTEFIRQSLLRRFAQADLIAGDLPLTRNLPNDLAPTGDLKSVGISGQSPSLPKEAIKVSVKAAVLFALVERAEPTLLLTTRSHKLRKHAGQISFAGGRVDSMDASAVHTALREAQEEIGLSPSGVNILGEMPEYFTVTGFCVTPVVASIPCSSGPLPLLINPHEVADVFEVPLAFLMNPANHQRHRTEFQGQTREWYSIPYTSEQDGVERFIWGATAGMIRNFYHYLIRS